MTPPPVVLLGPAGPDAPVEASSEPGFFDCRDQWHSWTSEDDD